MSMIGFALLLVGFIWSVARGIQVSMLCVVANFIFPPISQAIFSIYEPVIRAPLAVMAAGFAVLYLNGSISFGH
ncbi:hypothetical protein [Pseudomonas pseudonitroreducens]|uniref:hypothetical protein n=1 Tax=Pseudomonas pseudonitroreducens TaxID=2892326 RepID=UPI001F2BF097|nr:hypothetical protein [Pseudomonas pseudonitroreducens]